MSEESIRVRPSGGGNGIETEARKTRRPRVGSVADARALLTHVNMRLRAASNTTQTRNSK